MVHRSRQLGTAGQSQAKVQRWVLHNARSQERAVFRQFEACARPWQRVCVVWQPQLWARVAVRLLANAACFGGVEQAQEVCSVGRCSHFCRGCWPLRSSGRRCRRPRCMACGDMIFFLQKRCDFLVPGQHSFSSARIMRALRQNEKRAGASWRVLCCWTAHECAPRPVFYETQSKP